MCIRDRPYSAVSSAPGNRDPALFWPPPRSCPRGSAETGKKACNRGSRPRSSRRAIDRRQPRGFGPVVFDRSQSWGVRWWPRLGGDFWQREAVSIQKSTEDATEQILGIANHLAGLINGIIAVTQEIQGAGVEHFVVHAVNTFREVVETEEGCSFFQNAAQHIEMVCVKPTGLRRLLQFAQEGDMVKKGHIVSRLQAISI